MPRGAHNALTDEQVIDGLHRYFAKHGRVPSALDMRKTNTEGYCNTTVQTHFGSWNAAIKLAFPVENSQHVLLNGKLFLYEAKQPYETSGKSIRGGIEYDELYGMMRCHECGEFSTSLAYHLREHSIKAREYKLKHGLRMSTALVSDRQRIQCSAAARRREGLRDPVQAAQHMVRLSLRSKTKRSRSKQGNSLSRTTASRHNENGRCRVQTLQKLKLASKELKRTPSIHDLPTYNISYHDITYHFGSIRNAQKLAGLIPNHNGSGPKRKLTFSTEMLIAELRCFYDSHRRIPRSTDVKRGFFSSCDSTFANRFGGWLEAIRTAFTQDEIEKDGFWYVKRLAKPVISVHLPNYTETAINARS